MARVNLALAVLAALLLVAATLIITWMVFKRGIGLQSSWELETAIELMIGATFLASPYTLVTGGHVKMDLLDSLLSGTAGRWAALLPKALACAVCFYLGCAASSYRPAATCARSAFMVRSTAGSQPRMPSR